MSNPLSRKEPQIVFLEADAEDRTLIEQRFRLVTIIERTLKDDELIAACKDAAVVSCFINTRLTRAVIDQLPLLKLVSTRSVGVDHIDVAACKERGIAVCNTPDVKAKPQAADTGKGKKASMASPITPMRVCNRKIAKKPSTAILTTRFHDAWRKAARRTRAKRSGVIDPSYMR